MKLATLILTAFFFFPTLSLADESTDQVRANAIGKTIVVPMLQMAQKEHPVKHIRQTARKILSTLNAREDGVVVFQLASRFNSVGYGLIWVENNRLHINLEIVDAAIKKVRASSDSDTVQRQRLYNFVVLCVMHGVYFQHSVKCGQYQTLESDIDVQARALLMLIGHVYDPWSKKTGQLITPDTLDLKNWAETSESYQKWRKRFIRRFKEREA